MTEFFTPKDTFQQQFYVFDANRCIWRKKSFKYVRENSHRAENTFGPRGTWQFECNPELLVSQPTGYFCKQTRFSKTRKCWKHIAESHHESWFMVICYIIGSPSKNENVKVWTRDEVLLDNDDVDPRQAATIAAELLRGGTSPTAEALVVPQVDFFCHFQFHHCQLLQRVEELV